MKKGIITMFAFASLFIVACGGGETEEVVVEEVVAENAIYYADVNASEVNWRGEVAGVYGHEGYVNLQSGMIEMAGDEIIGGEFAVDMSAFYPTDTASYKDVDGGRITDLQNHLTQEDFFASATYNNIHDFHPGIIEFRSKRFLAQHCADWIRIFGEVMAVIGLSMALTASLSFVFDTNLFTSYMGNTVMGSFTDLYSFPLNTATSLMSMLHVDFMSNAM